jgi:large subunit ribosomal protein L9
MKVMLIKDVYKLGRAGEVKRVADGYGRNYLLPQGLAVLATPGALKQSERIKVQATVQRDALNEEMSVVAEQLTGVVLTFSAKASETGKLYGSVTTQMIADSLSEKTGVEINKRHIDSQPLRAVGEHQVQVRLTVDLVPEVKVIIYGEGEEQPIFEIEPDLDAEAEVEDQEVPEEEQPETADEELTQEAEQEAEEEAKEEAEEEAEEEAKEEAEEEAKEEAEEEAEEETKEETEVE